MPFILLFIVFFSSFSYASPPPIQLATKFHDDIIISDYWVSEQLDGIRAYWDGQQLISRQGKPFLAPKWFIADFPDQALDGELWIKRGTFKQLSKIIHSHENNEKKWRDISFMVFDLPSLTGRFTQRLMLMRRLIEKSTSPYLKKIPQHKIATHSALQEKLVEVLNGGGEGLILHHMNAYYKPKRNQDFMKLKRYDDAEAIVLQYVPGQGEHLGRMQALVVKTTDGIIFTISTGFSIQERENPPNIGDTITYQYIGKSKNNVPHFASYLRIRYPAPSYVIPIN